MKETALLKKRGGVRRRVIPARDRGDSLDGAAPRSPDDELHETRAAGQHDDFGEVTIFQSDNQILGALGPD